MQIGMKIFVIACCLFHIITALSSASPVPVKNPYFQTGQYHLIKVSGALSLLQVKALPLRQFETINSRSQELFPRSLEYNTQPVI